MINYLFISFTTYILEKAEEKCIEMVVGGIAKVVEKEGRGYSEITSGMIGMLLIAILQDVIGI